MYRERTKKKLIFPGVRDYGHPSVYRTMINCSPILSRSYDYSRVVP